MKENLNFVIKIGPPLYFYDDIKLQAGTRFNKKLNLPSDKLDASGLNIFKFWIVLFMLPNHRV
jgi:hypothetical protein